METPEQYLAHGTPIHPVESGVEVTAAEPAPIHRPSLGLGHQEMAAHSTVEPEDLGANMNAEEEAVAAVKPEAVEPLPHLGNPRELTGSIKDLHIAAALAADNKNLDLRKKFPIKCYPAGRRNRELSILPD